MLFPNTTVVSRKIPYPLHPNIHIYKWATFSGQDPEAIRAAFPHCDVNDFPSIVDADQFISTLQLHSRVHSLTLEAITNAPSYPKERK